MLFYQKWFVRQLFLLLFCLIGWLPVKSQSAGGSPKYEMRGVWVATVANIDWPSKPGLKVKEQKAEVMEIVSNCKALGLNAIFLQVRPAADVLYVSKLEPWSKVLTGEAGKDPKYDPLAYWVEEAHKNGLELHAWINPYRASMGQSDNLPPNHPYYVHTDMFVEYANRLYFNPGHPQASEHINAVVKELVQNYEIDGVHMDDYFYPYPVKDLVFPDSACYEHYGSDTFDDIRDWRRDNVNQTIYSLNKTIKATKPWVQFGISPFGVWRNKSEDPRGSDTMAGTSNYDGLYADVLTWMENGWIDYVAPQLYWETTHPVANYEVLAAWWNDNHFDIPVYVGHGIYKIGSETRAWQDPNQLPQQIELVREYPNLSGSIYFSYKHLKRDLNGLQDTLKTKFYRSKAVNLPTGGMERHAVPEGVVKLKAGRQKIKWNYEPKNTDGPVRYIVYLYNMPNAFEANNPEFIYDVCYHNKYRLPKKTSPHKKSYLVRVAVLDAYNNEGVISEPVVLKY